MGKITEEEISKCVKRFFIDNWNDKKHKIHCQAVEDCCFGMIKNTDMDRNIFIIASWIHDMGKIIDKKNHEIESINILKVFLNKYNHNYIFKDKIEIIKDCILNHRTNGKPNTLYGRIFKLADKVALIDKNWIKWRNQNENN